MDRGNTGGKITVVRVNLSLDFKVFDSLPLVLRDLLNHSRIRWSAITLRQLWQEMDITAEEFAVAFEKAECLKYPGKE